MADISKCTGDGCPLKNICYRFTAPSNEHWQAYFSVVPYDHEEKKCELYWEIKK